MAPHVNHPDRNLFSPNTHQPQPPPQQSRSDKIYENSTRTSAAWSAGSFSPNPSTFNPPPLTTQWPSVRSPHLSPPSEFRSSPSNGLQLPIPWNSNHISGNGFDYLYHNPYTSPRLTLSTNSSFENRPPTCNPSELRLNRPPTKPTDLPTSQGTGLSASSQTVPTTGDALRRHFNIPPLLPRSRFKRARLYDDDSPLDQSLSSSHAAIQFAEPEPPPLPTPPVNQISMQATTRMGNPDLVFTRSLEQDLKDQRLQSTISAQVAASRMPPKSQPATRAPPKRHRIHQFECCICLSPPTDLTMTPCGHLFCWECIHQAANASQGGYHSRNKMAKCPNCRKPFQVAANDKGLVLLSFKVRKRAKARKRREEVNALASRATSLFASEEDEESSLQPQRKETMRLSTRGGQLSVTPVIELD